MASPTKTLPSAAPSQPVGQAAAWFRDFLKTELAPYPGRAWVVARMTVASTIVMLLIMTFRLPSGFLAAIYTFNLSRESPAATLRSGIRIAIASTVATAYAILSVSMLVDDPLTHFLWIIGSLFLTFYALRLIPDYGTAISFAFPIAVSIPFWDLNTVNVNTRVSDTLWLGYLMMIGAAVTVAVEFLLHRVHPASVLTEGVDGRLKRVEEMLRDLVADRPISPQLENAIAQYSAMGTSRLRRVLLRSGYSRHFIAQMGAAVSLVGRLADLAASMRIANSEHPASLTAADRDRCLRLVGNITELRRHLLAGNPLPQMQLSAPEQPSNLPFLAEMERTVALVPQAFSGSNSTADFLMRAPMDEDLRPTLFTPDGFSNPAHLQFALRGTLAAIACYVTYTAIDWPGLQTSIVTCLVTAVSTIGSSRQKQMLRLGGVIIGGIILGMGAQVFVLPYLDSIVGFGLLFALITAIAAWIATATPRISYLGLQLALAFYLVHLQEFTIQTSLAIARDRLFGVLLGLISMWLITDRLGVRNALDEMQTLFARNLQMFADLTHQLLRPKRNKALKRIRELREQINSGFAEVRAQSDAILFEFGPSRQRKLEIRDDIRKWDPLLRTLLLVQITFSGYRLQRPVKDLPPQIAAAEISFNRDVVRMMQIMANEVNGKPTGPVPDVQASAAKLEAEIRRHSTDSGPSVPQRSADIIVLIRNLTSILVSLHRDIHIAFVRNRQPTTGPSLTPERL